MSKSHILQIKNKLYILGVSFSPPSYHVGPPLLGSPKPEITLEPIVGDQTTYLKIRLEGTTTSQRIDMFSKALLWNRERV